MQLIIIYTDGSCNYNPGSGGYGFILKYKNYRKEIFQSFKKTTNNRMELLAIIIALESLNNVKNKIIIYSDSKYIVNAIKKKWLTLWIKKKFKKIKNIDLWKRFCKIHKKNDIKIIWIKGHSKNLENILCDKLAVNSIKNNLLFIDYGYENYI